MADVEYSKNYAVYLTAGGVRYITNETSLQIIDVLKTGAATLTMLSEKIGIQISSVQSNISKLLREKYITSYKSSEDRRKMFYALASLPLISNIVPDLDIKMIENNVVSRIMSKDEDRYKIAMELIGIMPRKYGINMMPILTNCGAMIAFCNKNNFIGLDDNQLLIEIEKFAKLSKFPEIMVKWNDDSICLKIKNRDGFLNMVSPTLYIVSGFIKTIISIVKEKTYCIEEFKTIGCHNNQDASSNVVDESYMTTTIHPYGGNNYELLMQLLEDTKDPFKYKVKPFAIFAVGDKTVLFGNSTQVSILKMLEDKDMNLKEIVGVLKLPQITVHVSLSKLIEIGVVERNGIENNSHYHLISTPLLTPVKKNDIPKEDIDNLFKNITEKPDTYGEMIFKYVIESFHVTGIGLSQILYCGGKSAGNYITAENKWDAQEFVDNVCNMDLMNTKMHVEKYLPLRIRITEINNNNNHPLYYVMPFLDGIFRQGLTNITGNDYSVVFTTLEKEYNFQNYGKKVIESE